MCRTGVLFGPVLFCPRFVLPLAEQEVHPAPAFAGRSLYPDSDFDDDTLMDSSPEVSRRVGSMMGIGDDYHTTISPDLKSDDELCDCLKRINSIIHEYFD